MSIKYFSVLSGSLFASLIILTSCLPSEDSLTTSKTATGINGSWSARFCQQDQSDLYYQEKTTFDTLTNTALNSLNSYSDANCLILIEEIDSQIYGFTLGETITTDSGLAAREINVFQTEEMLPPVLYLIYRIDGDLLYFGDTTDIDTTSTPENRPTSLDFESPMTRI
jgi:hypothetical protein